MIPHDRKRKVVNSIQASCDLLKQHVGSKTCYDIKSENIRAISDHHIVH